MQAFRGFLKLRWQGRRFHPLDDNAPMRLQVLDFTIDAIVRGIGRINAAAALPTGLDIDIENAFQALHPGHRRSRFGWRWRFASYPDLVPPLPNFALPHAGKLMRSRRPPRTDAGASGTGWPGSRPESPPPDPRSGHAPCAASRTAPDDKDPGFNS